MSNDVERMKSYLTRGSLLILGTVSEDGLHSAAVWFATEDDFLHLIFTSRESRVHSHNIRNNARFSGAIVHGPLEGLGQKVQGLFMSGTASEVSGTSLREAYRVYENRWPQVAQMFSVEDIENSATPMRMYRLTVSEYSWLDEVNRPSDPKVVILPADLNK